MSGLYLLTVAIFIFVALLMCAIILMQESKSSGLGASFGGDPSQSLFGTSTTDVMKKITAWLALAFFILCLALSIWTARLSPPSYQMNPITLEEVD